MVDKACRDYYHDSIYRQALPAFSACCGSGPIFAVSGSADPLLKTRIWILSLDLMLKNKHFMTQRSKIKKRILTKLSFQTILYNEKIRITGFFWGIKDPDPVFSGIRLTKKDWIRIWIQLLLFLIFCLSFFLLIIFFSQRNVRNQEVFQVGTNKFKVTEKIY